MRSPSTTADSSSISSNRTTTLVHAALEVIDGRLPEDRLWFNATIESLGESGFRELAEM